MSFERDEAITITTGNRARAVSSSYHDVVADVIWPRNPTGWVFLGRAVHVVGKILHSEWRSYTPYGLLPDVRVGAAQDDMLIDEDAQTRYAHWLINKRGDDPDYIFRTNSPFDYLECDSTLDPVADHEWDFACDLSQEEWAIGLGNIRMFEEVQLRLVEQAEAGRLQFASRPLPGGEPKPMPRDWWFTDRYAPRFESLTIDPNNPFSQEAPKADVAEHIFVRADDLAAFAAEQQPSATPARIAPSSMSLSPYLRLMHEVQDQLALESGKHPQIKKSVLVEEILSRWNRFDLPPSGKLVDAMATMLRDPESQAGRGFKNLPRSQG